MKQVSEMPTSGQFVMIWEFHGAVWSSTVKIEDGIEHIYNENDDEFVSAIDSGLMISRDMRKTIKFFIAD